MLRSNVDKSLFSKTPAYLTHLFFLAFLSIIIMTMDYRYRRLEDVRTMLDSGFYPLYYLAEIPVRIKDKINDLTASRQELDVQNQTLAQQNLLLNKQLQKKSLLEAENKRLRNLLNMASEVRSDKVKIAELVRIDKPALSSLVTINKGLRDGVYIGQPVLDAQGVLGQIVHVAYRTSKLLLLTSTRHALPVQVNRNSYRTVTQGFGSFAPIKLKRVLSNADIEEGDLLVTSGAGDVFPIGYPVATVSTIKQGQQQFMDISVEPLARVNQIREVMLIWPSQAEIEPDPYAVLDPDWVAPPQKR